MSKSKSKSDDFSVLFHEHGIHIPTRTIWTCTDSDGDNGVDYTSASQLVRNLHILESMSKETITVYLNCSGGDEYQGMVMHNAIQNCISPVTVIASAEVCSMGIYILQAADHRISYPDTIFMYHSGTSNVDGDANGHFRITKNWIEFEERYKSRLNRVLLEKMKMKDDKLTLGKLDKASDFDQILTAEEALEVGIIDSILEVPVRGET